MATNNRRNRRVRCALPARAEGPQGLIKATLRNLSRGGSFLLTPKLVPVGKSIELLFDMPDRPGIRATGEVRYHHTYPEGEGMGVRFVRLSGEDLAHIIDFVEARGGNA